MRLSIVADGHFLIFQFIYEYKYSEQYIKHCWIDEDGNFRTRNGLCNFEDGEL